MRDSFFSARNHYDPQIADADRFACSALMEATTRRLVRVSGPLDAARLNYRLADICAGANVLPVELLTQEKSKEAAAEVPEPPKPDKKPLLDRIFDRMNRWPILYFYLGIFCGWLVFGM